MTYIVGFLNSIKVLVFFLITTFITLLVVDKINLKNKAETNRSKIAKMLIEEYDCKTAGDIQDALKDLLGDTLENMLKAQLDKHLDYEYGEVSLSLNTRNGTAKKTLNKIYPFIFLDAIHYNVRDNEVIAKKAVYIALGYNKLVILLNISE